MDIDSLLNQAAVRWDRTTHSTSFQSASLGVIAFASLLWILLRIAKAFSVRRRGRSATTGESGLRRGEKSGASGEPVGMSNVLPPSRRKALLSSSNPSHAKYQNQLKGPSPTEAELCSHQLSAQRPGSLAYDEPGTYTPTGFSKADIEALGSFPDYSVLSGVPHPRPCPDSNIHKTAFRPFRPFRWQYHQTMSLQKFEPDYWIELERNYFDMLDQRKKLLAQHGRNVLNYGPGSDLASRELMEMVLQFLCIRYPSCFELRENNTIFVNRLLNTNTHLSQVHPLQVLFDNVPEDFAIMMRNPEDGMYHLRAGFICSSIGWNFGTHFERSLKAIHTEVNDYAEKMSKSMDRYFSKMPTDEPIQRGAWFVEDHKPLFVTPDEYEKNAGTKYQGETVTIDDCYLRVDWQTLRRLPLSGAVVFNFKAVFTPMTELREEAYVPSLLYKQVTEGKPKITDGKVHPHLRPIVLPKLQEWKQEQVEAGVIRSDWEEETLAESPFYPGWEKIWQKRCEAGAAP